MSAIRLILDLSDLHSGSTTALMPPGFKNFEGNEVRQNPMQEWLWECWGRLNLWIPEIVAGDPYALVLNGDLIEGNHHGTKQIISPSVGDHVNCAFTLLAPVAEKAERVFVVRGTECHVGENESALGDMLGAEMNTETGKRVFDRLTLDLNGVRNVFRHHIGTSMRRNLAGSGLSIALAEEQVEAANNGEPVPRVLCCAHRHKFGVYQDDNGLCVVTPPWQMLTRFGHKVVSPARTKPGGAFLDYRGKAEGQLPEVRSLSFRTPSPKAFAL